MRSLVLFSCFMFGFVALCSSVSYADFSYDIDRFAVVGGPAGNSTFIDEFDDGEEPPTGPSGPLTYNTECPFPFLPTAESGGLLNLNKNNACDVSDEFIFEAVLKDSNFFINSDVGGSIEGKFRFTNGIIPHSGFAISIFSNSVNSDLESLYMCVQSDHHGNISATLDIELYDEDILISEVDITNSLIGISDITMKLDISSENVVTASLDFGSDGTFDLTLPGSHTLTFMSGISGYLGVFDAFWQKTAFVTSISGHLTTSIAGWDNLTFKNAIVSLEGTTYTTRSGNNGNFTFQSIPAGTYTLNVTAPDFVPIQLQITVTEGQNLQLTNIPPLTLTIQPTKMGDVDGDNQIGLSDVVYGLQVLSGIRLQ